MLNTIKIISIILFSSILLTQISFADEIILTNVIEETFNYDLQIGSTGEDVFKLQRFLNADENTAVSFSGNGSRGSETTYFGGLTQNAVIKFQNENSIIPADGYVGQETRQILNKMFPLTNFNKPYTNTIEEPTIAPIQNNNINLCQFIEVLISVGAIGPEKTTQAKSVINSLNPSSPCVTQSTSTNKTTTDTTYNWPTTYNSKYVITNDGFLYNPNQNAYPTTVSKSYYNYNPANIGNITLNNISGPKLKVTIDGTGGGSVSGEGLSCSGTTCQGNYKIGETVTLIANPTSSESPAWFGCNSISGNSCIITIKKGDEEIKVTFFLDSFGGFIMEAMPCVLEKGTLITVAGTRSGIYILKDKLGVIGVPVIGTLKNGKGDNCDPHGPDFRIIEDVAFGLKE